ncbi:MAG: hypothetical protein ACK2UK_13135, partial [Candidatus Promineifilaceae bacterium]
MSDELSPEYPDLDPEDAYPLQGDGAAADNEAAAMADILPGAGADGPDDESIGPFENAPEAETPLLLPAWSASTIMLPPAPRSLKAVEEAAAEPPPPPARAGRIRWGCVAGLVAALLVLSLLGSSLYSIYWFWNQRVERIAEVEAAFAAQHATVEAVGDDAAASATEALSAQPLATRPAERVDRIVIVNGERQIETMAPDGEQRRTLTSGSTAFQFPAWSPDGHSIAAIGSRFSGGGLYLVEDQVEAGEPQQLVFDQDDTPFYLYWSPEGSQISYLANSFGDNITLNVIDVGEADSGRIIAVGSPMYWNWTADSRRMLVHSGSGTMDAQLVMIDDFGRPLSRTVPLPGPFQAPGISPSSRYWAYSQVQAGGTNWLVLDDRSTADSQHQRHAGVVAFNWSPVRDEVAFVSGGLNSDESFWGPLRLMDAESGNVRLLSSDTVLAFFWSPDGSKIMTLSLPAQPNRYGEEFQVRDNRPRRLARYAGTAEPAPVQFSPHTFRINVVDVESGEGKELLEATLSPFFLAQFIAFFDQYALSHTIWSPDSTG